jgi:hypothetical protein
VDRLLVALLLIAVVVAATLAYRRSRARSAEGLPRKVDPDEMGLAAGPGAVAIAFTTPYCLACNAWADELRREGVELHTVDVAARPDLARAYGISTTPVVLAVELPDGQVLARYDGDPSPKAVARVAVLARA